MKSQENICEGFRRSKNLFASVFILVKSLYESWRTSNRIMKVTQKIWFLDVQIIAKNDVFFQKMTFLVDVDHHLPRDESCSKALAESG